MKRILIISIALLITYSPLSSSQEKSLSTCQNIKDKINYYQSLRRKGGSAPKMESWKQKRNSYEEKFKRYKCRNWGRKVY